MEHSGRQLNAPSKNRRGITVVVGSGLDQEFFNKLAASTPQFFVKGPDQEFLNKLAADRARPSLCNTLFEAPAQ